MSTSFNFPLTPTLNQIVVLPDGNSAQWNGYAWVAVGDNVTYPLAVPKGGTGATNPLTAKRNLDIPIWTLDDAAPAAPVFGDRWIRPGSMTEVVWLPNSAPAGGGVWVNLADVGSVAYPIPVSKGGTGATDAAGARANLGITPANVGSVAIDGSSAMTGPFKLADGTVAAPGLAFASEVGLGWYRSAAGNISMAVGGAQTYNFFAPTAAASYFVIGPRADGASNIQMWRTAVTNRVNTDFSSINYASDGLTISTEVAGTGTRKQLNFQSLVGINLRPGGLGVNIYSGSAQNALLRLVKLGGGAVASDIVGQVDNTVRWLMRLGDGSGNDDFSLLRYNDSGVGSEAVRINRLTNAVTINGGVAINMGGGVIAQDAYRNTGYVTEGSGNFRSLASTCNPNWNEITFEGYHQPGVAAMARIICGSGVMSFDNSGAIKISGDFAGKTNAGGWSALSDARIKDVVGDYTIGLEAVLALRPRTFVFKGGTQRDTARRHTGLVAQEAEAAMPDLVTTGLGEVGDIKLDDMRTLDITNITYALINSVKTLNARLAALEAA